MQFDEAENVLRDVERVRRDTRRDLHPLWYANVVIGAFFLVATACSAIATGPALPIACWAIGVPLGLVLIGRHEMRRERKLGAESRALDPSLGVFGATVAGVIAINAVTDGMLGQVAWIYPVAAGWFALAVLYRDAPMCAAAVALAAIGTAILAVEPGNAGLWAQLALAVLLIAAGLIGRALERA